MKRLAALTFGVFLAFLAEAQVTTNPSVTGVGTNSMAIGSSIASGTANSILFVDASGLAQDNTNLNYTSASGPRLQVGSGSTTSTGLILGYSSLSGFGVIAPSGVSPNATSNYTLLTNTTQTYIGSGSNIGTIIITPGGITKETFYTTAGRGPAITAGVAASAVSALSITQTWNYNAAALDGVLWTFTDTSSHASTNAFRILGGAAGTTELLTLSKTGVLALAVAQGTAAAPRLLMGTTNTGFWWPSGAPSLVHGGDEIFTVAGSTGIRFGSTMPMGWASDTTPSNTVNDTAFSRISAGTVAVGTGAANSVAGYLALKGVNSYSQATDAAPPVPLYRASNAYAQATVNTAGADLILGAGIGRRLATVVDYSLIDAGADTITITVNGTATVGTADAATQDGTHWVIGASNNATATNIATWMSTISGVTGAAVGASAYATPAAATHTLTISTNMDAGEGTVTSGTDGLPYLGAVTNGAGAATGTLTNAPGATNPSVWIQAKVIIGGTLTTVAIPAWTVP